MTWDWPVSGTRLWHLDVHVTRLLHARVHSVWLLCICGLRLDCVDISKKACSKAREMLVTDLEAA